MTEDILFDNLYIGHSVEDAKALADETFGIKKPLEVKANKPAVSDDDEETDIPSFKEDPIGFVRQKVLNFVDAAKADPVDAFKSQPETGALLVGIFLTFFGMLGASLGCFLPLLSRRRVTQKRPTRLHLMTRKRLRVHLLPQQVVRRRMMVA